jgi:transposase
MKKDSTGKGGAKRKQQARKRKHEELTIGIDLGDRNSSYCIVDERGAVVSEGSVKTTQAGLRAGFGKLQRSRVAIEAGTHSAWVARVLGECGHEVIVANARAIPLLTANSGKTDPIDAEMLARMARVDPALLHPIRHRSQEAHGHLTVIRARRVLVEARTKLMNAARGLVKPLGERLPSCSPAAATVRLAAELAPAARMAIEPLLTAVEALNEQIQEVDHRIEAIGREHYAEEVRRLTQVKGVGTLVALTFVLTLEDPARFRKSRDVGCYIGARPKRDQSGKSNPQLGITKEGDEYLRTLLVNSAQYILGRFGPDTDLRRWGLKLCRRGGANARKRAVVAVVRKLSVLLHRLWVSGQLYDPLRNSRLVAAAA